MHAKFAKYLLLKYFPMPNNVERNPRIFIIENRMQKTVVDPLFMQKDLTRD